MAGINLSQSTQNKKELGKENSFDKSFSVVFIIFILVAGTWAGMAWYIHSLDQKIADLGMTLENNASQLRGRTVDRVADFDKRLSLINKNLGVPVEPKDVLENMERLMVPNVFLIQYQFNKEAKLVTVEGITDNFKYVAQQIQSLKADAMFTEVKADTIRLVQDGKIIFTLHASLQ